MPRDKAKRPALAPKLMPQAVGEDPDRAIGELAGAIQRLEGSRSARQTLVADLVVGANTLNHGLGRRPAGVSITPTVADATFAWSLASSTDKQLTITVVGTGQPGASLEVF